MSLLQVQESKRGKEAIWPAVVISASATTLVAASLAEKTPQAHPEPAVEPLEDPRRTAVLKVREPASKRLVDLADNEWQRVPRGTFRFLAQRSLGKGGYSRK